MSRSLATYGLSAPPAAPGEGVGPAERWLDLSLLPGPTPCYPYIRDTGLPACPKWRAITTREQAIEYARRFFRAAARGGLRHRSGSPLRAVFADAARMYVQAHEMALDMDASLTHAVQLLGFADQRNATALAIERQQAGSTSTTKSPSTTVPTMPRPQGQPSTQRDLGTSAWIGITAASALLGGLALVYLAGPREEIVEETETVGRLHVPCGCR